MWASWGSPFSWEKQRKAGEFGLMIQGDKAKMMETRNEELGQDLNNPQTWMGAGPDWYGGRAKSQRADGTGLTGEGRQLLGFSQNIFGLEPDRQEQGQMPLGGLVGGLVGQVTQMGGLPRFGTFSKFGNIWQ